mgnify:CR=1 FL=1
MKVKYTLITLKIYLLSQILRAHIIRAQNRAGKILGLPRLKHQISSIFGSSALRADFTLQNPGLSILKRFSFGNRFFFSLLAKQFHINKGRSS